MNLNELDLNKLNVFQAVAEAGGITNASRRLRLTRSAISQSVSALERSLGVTLFLRVGKKLILTAQGDHLFRSVREYQQGLQAAIAGITHSSAEAPSGSVRVGLFIGFSRAKLTEFLARFLNTHPRIGVRLLFVSQPDLSELLLENKIDLALSIYPLDRAERGRAIRSEELMDEELVLVSGKKHYLARPELKALQALPVVDYYASGQTVRNWIRHHFGKEVGALNVRAYAAAIDFVLELILRDVGIGIIPRYVAEPYLASKKLFLIRTGKPELKDAIWLNRLKNATPDPAVRTFLEQLKGYEF